MMLKRPAPNASSESPLRLAWLIDSLTTGGAERLAVTFAEEALRRSDVRLTVIALSDRPGPFRDELEALGVDLVVLTGAPLVAPGRFLQLLSALRSRQIEIVHAHLTGATILGAAASAVLGTAFIATVHNVRLTAKRMSRVRSTLYTNAVRRRSTRLVAVGCAVAEANAASCGGRPFVVIPNGFSDSSVWRGKDRDAARAEIGVGPRDTLLLAVGMISPQKAYEDLVDAFAVVAARPDTRLAIAGGGRNSDLGRSLVAHVAAHGLTDRVSFLGVRRDIPRLLTACDVFVSASHWEGAPVSLLEAMANGTPCLVTDVGDNRLALEGTGCPTPPAGDPARLAAELDALLCDPARMAACASALRARAVERFSAAEWVDRHLDLYAETCPPHRAWRAMRREPQEASCVS